MFYAILWLQVLIPASTRINVVFISILLFYLIYKIDDWGEKDIVSKTNNAQLLLAWSDCELILYE